MTYAYTDRTDGRSRGSASYYTCICCPITLCAHDHAHRLFPLLLETDSQDAMSEKHFPTGELQYPARYDGLECFGRGVILMSIETKRSVGCCRSTAPSGIENEGIWLDKFLVEIAYNRARGVV